MIDQAPAAQAAAPDQGLEGWRQALFLLAERLGRHPSPEQVAKATQWAADMPFDEALLRLAATCGVTLTPTATAAHRLPPGMMPALATSVTGQPVVIWAIRRKSAQVTLFLEDGAARKSMPLKELGASVSGRIFLVGADAPPRDSRIDSYTARPMRGWLWPILRAGFPVLTELALASCVSALLAIGVTLFAMQVWDRVVPAQSLNTLWVLALGVGVALLGDFILRLVKARMADQFGKNCDRWLSDHVFSRMLDVRNDSRPRSKGSFIAQIRDVEQIREMLTSTTITALIDLPFAAVFFALIWYLGGPLVYVPLAATVLILLVGAIVQWPLSRLSQAGMVESALRNAILIESVTRIEDIKQLQAEERFRSLWNRTIAAAADVSERQRRYRNFLMFLTMTVQQLAYVGALVVGVYLILDGQMTTGAVIACSILTSRAIAPLSQLSGLFSVIQNARVGKAGLDRLLALPLDHAKDGDRFQREALRGAYRLSAMVYSYRQEDDSPALVIPQLSIAAGEKVAVIGRIGSGKSTLLRLLAGQAEPRSGSIVLDDTMMAQIDMADLRRDIGYMSQTGDLFYGSIRENLRIANPGATDAEIAAALRLSCADRLLQKQANGLDLQIGEGGTGVSNGQRQSLLLARLILRDPNIVLLDEPTASLDEGTERLLIDNLKGWLQGRTLVVATHRFPILELVDRLIVIESGRILMDGPKAEILQRLKSG